MAAQCQLDGCHAEIRKPRYWSGGAFRERKYCSKAHWDEALRVRNRLKHPPAPPQEIPPSLSRVTTWADLPTRCCWCGGLWRPVHGGVRCLTCGRDVFVVAALEEPTAYDQPTRWPSATIPQTRVRGRS